MICGNYSEVLPRIYIKYTLFVVIAFLCSCQTNQSIPPENSIVSEAGSPQSPVSETQDKKKEEKLVTVEAAEPAVKTINSGKESKKFSHEELHSISPDVLKRLQGYWLPLQFFQEIDKHKSLLTVALFPPLGSISIEDEEVLVVLPDGSKHTAMISGKPAELLFVIKDGTYHFELKGNDLVWTVGKEKVTYRRTKNLEDTFTTLMNGSMMSGTYFSMLTRTLIVFHNDGRVSGMGGRYTNYRFPQNQRELERSGRTFDVIYLYHKKRPSAGRWYALVYDDRSAVKVIARIREYEDKWYLSSNAYMLRTHDF